MKTPTTLHHLLACTLLLSGCDFLDDIADSDSDDDDNAGDTGDGDDEDGDDDESEDDDGKADDGGEADHGGADESEGGGGETDDDGADESESEGGGEAGPTDGGETDGESDAVACEEGATACIDAITIAVCVDGEPVALDCNDACFELQGVPAIGCYFDEEAGADLCVCDDGSGEGAGEGGA